MEDSQEQATPETIVADSIGEEHETADSSTPHGEQPQTRTDWKSEARRWERRAKTSYKQLQETQEREEENTQLKTKLEEQAEQYKQLQAQHEQLQAQVALEAQARVVAGVFGVPAALLRGSSRGELEEHAQAIAEFLAARKDLPTVGAASAPENGVSSAHGFVRALFGQQ